MAKKEMAGAGNGFAPPLLVPADSLTALQYRLTVNLLSEGVMVQRIIRMGYHHKAMAARKLDDQRQMRAGVEPLSCTLLLVCAQPREPSAAVCQPHPIITGAQRIDSHLFMISPHRTKPGLLQQLQACRVVRTEIDKIAQRD